MRLRPAVALAAAIATIVVGLAPAASPDGPSPAPQLRGGGDGRLTITKSGKRRYNVRLRLQADGELEARIRVRVVGQTVTGERNRIDATTVEENAGPGEIRIAAPVPGAASACYPYVRCKLVAAASWGAATSPTGTPPRSEGTASAKRPVPTGRPRIRDRPIAYGAKRRAQMAAYSKRHYGERVWRLEPRGIVQHYTASSTAGPALNTFEANRPDVEYGELPGVCAHYLIDRDGTILGLVPTDVRCRHTVGLNHATIGIEHVGRSDRDVVGRPRVLRASLTLTGWLRCAYGIERSNVIGHNESLDSPLYKELDPRFQGRTHGDMRPATMKSYRKKLGGC